MIVESAKRNQYTKNTCAASVMSVTMHGWQQRSAGKSELGITYPKTTN